ncbi:MAG TPA: FAD-dependent monooxygenase [Xanthobacteraceae bacterium]|nr:FAD-dependent monooxygenase [Xanthobacteraceae bacterium]
MAERPVVVAGAGPTGLMCALALGRRGVPVIVLEAEPALAHDLRAGTFHPPTLEMMAPYGITARMLETGLPVQHWQIRDKRGELIAQFDLGLLADLTPHPYRLHLEQHRLTPIQLAILRRETDADIRFGHRLTGFSQQADHVRVEVEPDDGAQTIAAAFLIGADGGRSTVRKILDVAFEGFTWPEQFVVASTPYDFAQHGFAMNSYVSDPVDWAAVFKMPDVGPPGIWRAVFPGDPALSDEALLDADAIENGMQRVLPRGERFPIRYKSVYRVHQRVAKSFRAGRVLLAGDAAHLNNPMGGFGLNSGIHDAVNLADKLARVWHGDGDDSLLDLYARQRRAATIDHVQAMSIRNKRLLEERDPQVQRRQLTALIAIAGDPERARKFLLDSSMIAGLQRANEVT